MSWDPAEEKISVDLKAELRELCAKMIDILSKAKENGKISENEYVEYTRLKKKLLD